MASADITGRRFGKLIAQWPVGPIRKQRAKVVAQAWLCVCDCRNLKVVPRTYLFAGTTSSCGCAVGLARIRHGQTNRNHQNRIYWVWSTMKQRCYNPKTKDYPRYGGRGITVCEEWRNSYLSFMRDMGERPHQFTLERINNDGSYEPRNCIWASPKQQANNKRNSRRKAA